MEKAEKKYKAVVEVVVKKLQGVFVATCGGVDWTSRPSYLWKITGAKCVATSVVVVSVVNATRQPAEKHLVSKWW